MHRRESERTRSTDLTKKIVLWGAVAGALTTLIGFLTYSAQAYVRLSNAVSKKAKAQMDADLAKAAVDAQFFIPVFCEDAGL